MKWSQYLTNNGMEFVCPCVRNSFKRSYPDGISDISGHRLTDELVEAYFMAIRFVHEDRNGKRICLIKNNEKLKALKNIIEYHEELYKDIDEQLRDFRFFNDEFHRQINKLRIINSSCELHLIIREDDETTE